MKNLRLAFIFVLAMSVAQAQSVVKTSAQEVATADLIQKRELEKKTIISLYLDLKQNLIVSDSVQAAKSAAGLAAALNTFKFKKLTLEEMNAATVTRGKLKTLALSIAATHHINTQRSAMNDLSEEMWTIIGKLMPEKTVLYEQKCPMAGKVWISDVKEIKNPYFPKNMLTCGEVIASAGEGR